MGYSWEMFYDLAELQLPGKRVFDVGSQDLHFAADGEIFELNKFVRKHGGTPLVKKAPGTLTAREIFEQAGFEYTCCDVDERPGTIFIDISRLKFPRHLRSKFDLVSNVGTTEHLANPVAGFALIHYLTKPGGVMYHDVPLYGLGNHGLCNPTPKFWHSLIKMNEYSVIDFKVRSVNEEHLDEGNFVDPEWTYISGIADLAKASAMVRVVVRKERENIFLPPIDAVSIRSDLKYGALEPYVAMGAYSRREITAHRYGRFMTRAFNKIKRIVAGKSPG